MKRILFISIIFLTFSVLYFSPVQLPSKLTYPVAFLALMALVDYKNIGVCMALGLLFSALGDWEGTQGNFLGQMGCFGLGHMAYIGYFVSTFKTQPTYKQLISYFIPCFIIGFFAFVNVVPMAPTGIIRVGVSIYCVLILIMLWTALLHRDVWFALGATLFVVSDFILAWNKFVSPIDHASWWIMVPYYAAQWLLFIRATSVESVACSCTSRGK
ncbi:MAG: lysoplasmalogenase [Bacteroidaceae bacterium]|nr:lysoplasmalogenase [Bacteroidaceae bacterium]